MATITEDYVSFKTAKLLKEKGFPQDPYMCNTAYTIRGKLSNNAKSFISPSSVIELTRSYAIAPTQQMAMKWLREVHDIHIAVDRGPKGYHLSIQTIPLGVVKYITREITGNTYVNSYEEAIEAAISYCLEKLI